MVSEMRGPTWAHVHFGRVPGIAMDAQDNVWVFTRTHHPVQVHSATGKLSRGWRRWRGEQSASAQDAFARERKMNWAGAVRGIGTWAWALGRGRFST